MLHDVPGAPRLVITQNDVRQIQLAKAALYAGCRLLMDAFGIETVDRIRLAGAFGAHIDPVHAMVLGLVPDCDPASVTSAGNAAGTGARIALLNRAARDEIEERRAAGREARDRGGATVPGALRGGDGHPAHDRSVPAARRRRRPAGAQRRVRRRRSTAGDGAATPPTAHRREEHLMSDEAPAAPQATTGRWPRGRDRPRGCTPWPRRSRSSRGRCTPVEVLNEEGLATIEHNADTILEQVGIEFHGAPDALELFKGAGCRRRRRARAVPARAVPPARAGDRAAGVHAGTRATPRNSVQIGGNATVLAPAYGSPFVRDLDGGRRYGTIEDFRNFVKLAYSSPFLHHSGGTVCEPVDLPVNKRHYDMVYAHMRYSDRPFMGSVTHPQRARGHGRRWRASCSARTTSRTSCVVLSLINANSPLVWDSSMLGAARAYAEANQAVIMTPFILAGAMSPATVAGAATQTLAEALAGMAYVQLVRPGAPVVFGSFASSMSMQSGAPTFGTPEPALVLYTLAACARRLGVPFRSGGSLTASKIPDAQAAYESANTLQPTVLAGVNFVLHAAGWLEGGLAMGYEKFVMDLDQCGMMRGLRQGRGPLTERPGVGRDHRERAGPALPGHGAHARQLRDGVLPVSIADNNSFEQWEIEGSRGRDYQRRTRSGRRCSPSTRRQRSTRPRTRSSASGSSRRRRPSRTRTL